jgi:fibronectin-binding autotransporter adhesin
VSWFAAARIATAQPEGLEDHVWVGGTGNQQWRVDANWNPTPFPNDPGRVDADPATIADVVGANLSVNLAADLNVNVGATDITVAALTIGGMTAPVATTVSASGGRLVFENFESNNNTDPGNVICAFNCGAALITSQGVAGATNTISAVVGVNDQVHIAGSGNITLAGGVAEMNPGGTLSALSPNVTVMVTGGTATVNSATMPGQEDVPLALNFNSASQGTIDVSGVISGPGRMRYGNVNQNPTLPFGTVILRGNNTYSGRTIMSRGNVVLAHNNALGTADVKHDGPSNQVGYNFLSDDDSRTIPNNIIIAQWQTIKGNNSLTLNGITYQDNARGWINMLPAGKTLTLGGGQFPNHLEENPPQEGRILTFDGTGRTVVTGGLHDDWSTETQTMNTGPWEGSFRFRGTGAVVVSGVNSTYTGSTIIEGGNVHFATNAHLGNTSQIASTSGAVGLDAGVVNNVAFLGLLNSSTNPANDAAANPVVWDRGGLMLGTGEYGMNLNFTSGPLANASDMSLAAHEGGSTYTGTITPARDTYRLGGGSGVLTLPNANQLTGENSVEVTNGGEVRIAANNNYTGATRIIAKYQTSLIEPAEADNGNNIPNDQLYIGTTLTATTLADGGSPSSIGNSTSLASNLHIQGSTLKYVGGAASTDRLFTIGTGGATIDASGTGAINFTNTSALGIDVAEPRTGNASAFATGQFGTDRITIRNLTSTEDLHPGMLIMTPNMAPTGSSGGIPANTVITRITSPTDVVISNPIGDIAFGINTPVTFGPAPERALTLTGMNTGNNTLAAIIPNASDGGVVGVTKAGAGKWILTGSNTYTGATNVDEGTLLINGNQTGTGTTTVAAGAALGGTGSLGGNVLFEGGGQFVTEFVSGMIDPLAIAGNVDLSALGNALNVISTGTGSSWVIATYTGSLTGAFEIITTGFSVDYGTGANSQITLNLAGPGGVLGDYNQNGTVDAADYVLWRNNLGAGSLPNEGGISPGNVDVADYNFWRSRFGATAGAGIGVGASNIPEPSTALILGIAMMGLFGISRRRW